MAGSSGAKKEDKMAIKKLARQGDILFIRVNKLPKGLKKATDNIVAHGEVTGHAHRVREDAGVALLEDEQGSKFVQAEESWKIIHDEHGPISLDAGKWEARRQRECSPEAIRKVAD